MPLCELSVGANPDKCYTVGAGVQLWTWSPVSVSAFNNANNPVENLFDNTSTSQRFHSITRVIESSTDLTDVLKFSQKFSADARLAKITARIKHVGKQAAKTKSVVVFVGQAWRGHQPTSQVSQQLSLSPSAADLLSKQGEKAFEQEFGLFYVNRIFKGGCLSVLFTLEYRSIKELQEIKAKADCGGYGFGAESQHAMSSGRTQTRSSTSVSSEAIGWDPNIALPNSYDEIMRVGARFNSHPGTNFWLDLAPYSSLPIYQAATAARSLSRQLTIMPCEKAFQMLQDEYAAVQSSSVMVHCRRATDSHGEALLSQVQSKTRAGQTWFQQHQTTESLLEILVGDKQPYSFSHSDVSATEEICRDTVRGRCGGTGGQVFDDNHLALSGESISEISFRTGMLLDNVCVTYGGQTRVQHGGNGGQGHASLFLKPQEDIVGVAMRDGWLPIVGTCVKDVTLVVANQQTKQRRAWSARDEAIDMRHICGEVTEVPGKVLKCFTGCAGLYVDQISCVWHTPVTGQN